jgi:transcriptional/translational regulatory protein YebC/TACO1
MFHKKGTIRVPKGTLTEDDMLAIVLDAGADDLKVDGDSFEITTAPEAFEAVKKAIEEKKIPVEEAEIHKIPENTVKVEGPDAEKVLKLMEALEEHDDTQHVYANFDIDEKVLANFSV